MHWCMCVCGWVGVGVGVWVWMCVCIPEELLALGVWGVGTTSWQAFLGTHVCTVGVLSCKTHNKYTYTYRIYVQLASNVNLTH